MLQQNMLKLQDWTKVGNYLGYMQEEDRQDHLRSIRARRPAAEGEQVDKMFRLGKMCDLIQQYLVWTNRENGDGKARLAAFAPHMNSVRGPLVDLATYLYPLVDRIPSKKFKIMLLRDAVEKLFEVLRRYS
ncbi:hypothetical protein H2199_005834 [Coniosporium tulheliwenetii]|uniref:Uncharacterized protein n=1 Tax=Coniosporium tulheliwenetii TaxID=3383036 RepID=A0ACC2YYA2_9PEZI|nr:hypothetical protein H2199_005834 [Cladosporium sp. JES 115]